MLLIIDFLEEGVILLVEKVFLFDYSNDIKGNGYRSLFRFVEYCFYFVIELFVYC